MKRVASKQKKYVRDTKKSEPMQDCNNPIIHLKLDNMGYSFLPTHKKIVMPHLVLLL
jgi:hypothetical protein